MRIDIKRRFWNLFTALLLVVAQYPFISVCIAQTSQQPNVLKLDQILEQMELNYPQLQQYDYSKQAAQARVSGARSWMPPTATFGLSRIPYNPKMIDMPLMQNQSGLMIAVEQMIPNPARQRAQEKYLQSQVPAIEQQKAWTLNQLRAEARLLYFNRFVAEKMLQVINKSEGILQLLIQLSETNYAYNQASLNNIYSARARLEELRNQRLEQQQMIAESNLGLNTLMGRPENLEFTIDTTSIPKTGVFSFAIIDTALATRSDIGVMQSTIQAMQANQELMRSELKPTFGVRFEHMPMFNMESMYSVMGMVTIPFAPWASKMTKAEVKAMDFDIQSMQKQIATMRLMQARMTTEKQTMLKLEQERVANYQNKVLPAYRKALDVNLLGYRNNTADLFRVLEAWEMWQMKEMDYYQLLSRALKLEVEYAQELEK